MEESPNSPDSHDDSDVSVSDSIIEARTRSLCSELNDDIRDNDDDDCPNHEDDDCPNHEDIEDWELVHKFVKAGCGCMKHCHKQFSLNAMYMHRLHVQEIEREAKDMYVMGVIAREGTYLPGKTKRDKERKRASRSHLNFKGTSVCKRTFMMCNAVGKKYLQRLSAHIKSHGVTPRGHGNAGRKARNAYSFENLKCVVDYLKNAAEEQGLPQPAAPRGRDDIPPIYLPADTFKRDIHEQYTEVCEQSPTVNAVSLTLFKNVWNTCVPRIKIASPREDVCAKCEKMRKEVMDARTEDDKLVATELLRDHILTSQNERTLYNDCVRRSREDPGYTHYTFDFSQNMSLPHYSRQTGPLYFLSLRKIQLFGFRIDGTPRQLNFLIDEDQTIGADGKRTHGPDAVLSMVDWALETYGANKHRFSIHADNCPGQNKNKYTMGYFMWRVMTGQSSEIEFLMQTPGHARCHVDAGFANIKKNCTGALTVRR